MRWAVFFLILFGIFGCKARILRKYCTNDTVQVNVHFIDTIRDTVFIAGMQIPIVFNPDSFRTDSVYSLFSDSIANVSASKDNKGNVSLKVVYKDRKIPIEKIVYRNIPVKVVAKCEKCLIKLSDVRKLKWVIIVSSIILFYLIIRFIKK